MGRTFVVEGHLILRLAAHGERVRANLDEAEKGLGAAPVAPRQMKDLCVETRIAEAPEDITGLTALAGFQSAFFDGDE